MCDTIAIVQTDRVLFAKNSDREPNEAQLLQWNPRRRHRPGSRVHCTWIEIPEVRETHATLLSRPFWMWGAEMGANEHGVVIGNEAVFTREPYAKTGLTGMDLVRLALERADSRERACEVITELLETHGQGGPCGHEDRNFTYHNSFLIADAKGALVLETAGRHWAVERVEGARTISNGLTIRGFAERHSDILKTHFSACRLRQARSQALAEACTGLADLFDLVRDHGEARVQPTYRLLTGANQAVCMHAGGLVKAAQTTASWVSELRPEGAAHWVTATAAPCVSLFKPVRVDEPVTLLPLPTDIADHSLWWRHERLHRAVMRNPELLGPLFLPERDSVEARWLEDPPEPETAFEQADRLLECWTKVVVANRVEDVRPAWVRRLWRRRNRRARLRWRESREPAMAREASG
ncbi:MAG: carcinine hydrolase/isopenicillin-N N-acyltransferase family protein [Pirellulales bacterium]